MIRQTRTLMVSSPEFTQGGIIPVKYTADGEGINPPLEFGDIPEDTKSLALIMEDTDAPKGAFTHWILWDIISQDSIGENSNPGVSGVNSGGKMGYLPPRPPSGHHRYFFHIYALDSTLNLRPGANRDALESAMNGHILVRGTLMGR